MFPQKIKHFRAVSTDNYRPDIDGLRAVAVLSILLFHLNIPGFDGGFVGVDIFFVISGFLITQLIKEEIEKTGGFSFKNFYIRRIRRLFPALFATLFLTSIFATLLLSPVHLQSFGGSLASALFSISNIFFWFEADYFDVSGRVKPLLHTWSLSVEEQFYLIWPAILFFISRKNTNRFACIFLILSLFISLYLSILFSDGSVLLFEKYSHKISKWIENGRSTIFFLTPFRIFEFAIGAILVWSPKRYHSNRLLGDAIFSAGLFMIACSVHFYNDDILFPSYYGLLPCIGTGMLIFSGQRSSISKLLTNNLFVGIGLISYSLYLVHWPVIVFWNYASQTQGTIEQGLKIILIIVLSILSYRFIELPFRYPHSIKINFKIQIATVILILLLAFTGLNMRQSYGWNWRVDSPVNFENIKDAGQFHKEFYGGSGYPFYGPVNSSQPPDIILMGDSHGRQFAEGLYEEWTKHEALSFYIASGTSFLHLPDFVRVTKGEDWGTIIPECMNKAYSFIEKATRPPIVIISHAWLAQITKADIVDKDSNRMNKNITWENVASGISSLKSRIGNGLLIVIGEVPGTEDVNMFDIITRPTFLFRAQKGSINYLTSPANDEKAQFNNYLDHISRTTGEFVFLNPFEILCQNKMCQNVDQKNRLIYSDRGHLSIYGSRLVIRSFLPQLHQATRNHLQKDNKIAR